ncbi:MAG TPA: hypothetical protein PLI30_11990, partial [Petrimonas sp.]|nr:hypothetical protein [Petrimonas sp.]
MRNVDLLFCFLCLNFLLSGYCIENIHSQPIKNDFFVDITPNQFKGSDIERIQQAIRLAQKTSRKVVIPQSNANGTLAWKIDRAILLPSDITIILDNCTIQLSDECRDNMYRSENVGTGIQHPVWLNNIHLIG